jgi:archaellum biogenesis protein FlaJ (TadC family)
MPTEVIVTTVAHVIQLAVAPVFLLTGVGTILNVMTSRLSRIIDRFRVLERIIPNAEESRFSPDEIRSHQDEMKVLAQRERVIYWAISLSSICALLICVVIATLFIGSVMGLQLSSAIAFLFILAMLALIGGLLSLLREIYIATGSIHRVGKQE